MFAVSETCKRRTRCEENKPWREDVEKSCRIGEKNAVVRAKTHLISQIFVDRFAVSMDKLAAHPRCLISPFAVAAGAILELGGTPPPPIEMLNILFAVV
jgi:hypothetical protein